MPLNLDASTERPKQIQWDPTLEHDWEEADKRIRELRNQGFTLRAVGGTLRERGVAFMEPPKRDPNTILFRVLSEDGDTRLVWDRRDPKQVREAAAKFKEYRDQGYTIYAVRRDGSKGSKMEDFDPLDEEAVAEAVVVPHTMPG